MHSSSDNYPLQTVESNGKTQIRFNVVEKSIEDMTGSRTVYDFDFVELEGDISKEKIIEAILANEHQVPEPVPEVILEAEIIKKKPDITSMVVEAVAEIVILKKAGTTLEEYKASTVVKPIDIQPIEGKITEEVIK